MALQIAIGRQESPRFARAMRQMFASFARRLFDPYRPEQHYMRGPGPKWRAKHGVAPRNAA